MPGFVESKAVSAFEMYKVSKKSTKKKNSRRRKKTKKEVEKIDETTVNKIKKPKPKSTGSKSLKTPLKPIKIKPDIKEEEIQVLDEEEVPQLVEIPQQPDSEFIPPEDPSIQCAQLFKWLISPMTPKKFFHNFWEQKPVHIKRQNQNYYDSVFSSRHLDSIVRKNTLFFTRNIDVVVYEHNEKQVFNQEGRATASALWDYYANGCSVRLLNPQTYHPKIHILLATLTEYFGSMAGANVYLTPPNSQGFAPHYDDIEAFVVQIEGKKHWKLYPPKGSDVLARFSSPNLSRKQIGAPFMEATLEAGDILYFPRGTIHEGRTTDAHSLHMTISVYQKTAFVDLLELLLPKALQQAAGSNVELRRGLPLHYLNKSGMAARDSREKTAFKKQITSLLQSVIAGIESADVDAAADQLGRRLMRDAMPPVPLPSERGLSVHSDGPILHEGRVLNRIETNPDTMVRLMRYYSLRTVQEGDEVRLYYSTENANVYHGEEEQFLVLDEELVPAVIALQNVYPNYVKIEDIPVKDEERKIQLVFDLWERGLLVTDVPMHNIDSDVEEDGGSEDTENEEVL